MIRVEQLVQHSWEKLPDTVFEVFIWAVGMFLIFGSLSVIGGTTRDLIRRNRKKNTSQKSSDSSV